MLLAPCLTCNLLACLLVVHRHPPCLALPCLACRCAEHHVHPFPSHQQSAIRAVQLRTRVLRVCVFACAHEPRVAGHYGVFPFSPCRAVFSFNQQGVPSLTRMCCRPQAKTGKKGGPFRRGNLGTSLSCPGRVILSGTFEHGITDAVQQLELDAAGLAFPAPTGTRLVCWCRLEWT